MHATYEISISYDLKFIAKVTVDNRQDKNNMPMISAGAKNSVAPFPFRKIKDTETNIARTYGELITRYGSSTAFVYKPLYCILFFYYYLSPILIFILFISNIMNIIIFFHHVIKEVRI